MTWDAPWRWYDVTAMTSLWLYFQFSYAAFLLYYSFTLLTNFSEESTYHEHILSFWVFTLFCDEIRQVCWILLGLLNTLRPRQNGRHFPDDIFKWIFLNKSVWTSINISLKFVPRGANNSIPTLVQVMAWRRLGDRPLSEPMMVCLLTHICVTRLNELSQRPLVDLNEISDLLFSNKLSLWHGFSDTMIWKHFPHYWSFQWIPLTNVQQCGALMFSLLSTCRSFCEKKNSLDSGDLWRLNVKVASL